MSGATTPILGIPQIAPTQTDKTTSINDAIIALEGALQDQTLIDMSLGNVTLTQLQYTRYQVFVCSGQTANRNLVTPARKRLFKVRNSSATYTVTVGNPSGATVVVPISSMVEIQNDGANCYLSVLGGVGASGDPGGVTIPYTFSTTTTNADPGSGLIRLNNGTQASATAIYASIHDTAAVDWTSLLDNLTSGGSTEKGLIRLFNTVDPTKWIVCSLLSETTHTGYREFGITVVATSGVNPLGNGDALAFTFSRTGDAATSTTNTWTAAQRSSEATLTYGATVTPDLSLSNNYVLTLTGNCTIANPTNMPPTGKVQSGQITIIQDSTGGRTLAWGSQWYFSGGLAVAPASGAGAISVYSYHQRGGSYALVSAAGDFQHT